MNVKLTCKTTLFQWNKCFVLTVDRLVMQGEIVCKLEHVTIVVKKDILLNNVIQINQLKILQFYV
jgi:hypothetical protein